MIDTLARHLAALSEARRLLGLVLANNPAFASWREACATGATERGDLETRLSDDRNFVAFRHICEAIALLEPEKPDQGMPQSGSVAPISERVTLLETHRSQQPPTIDLQGPASENSPLARHPKASTSAADLPSPSTPVATIVNDALVYTPSKWSEAVVEIVREEQPAEPERDLLAAPHATRRTGWLGRLRAG